MKYDITFQGRASQAQFYPISTEALDFWQNNEELLDDYLMGEEMDIPQGCDFFDGDLIEEVIFDDESIYIIVSDEHKKVVYEGKLYNNKEMSIKVDTKFHYVEHDDSSLYVYDIIKGAVFGGSLDIDGEFDINKLWMYREQNGLGDFITKSVWYEDQEIINDDFSWMCNGRYYHFD